jgi:hypothetical protein
VKQNSVTEFVIIFDEKWSKLKSIRSNQNINPLGQRTILNFTPGTQGWNLFPRGEVHPFVHPQEWTLFIIKKNGGVNREFHPQGITIPLGDKIHPWGITSPLGVKVRP